MAQARQRNPAALPEALVEQGGRCAPVLTIRVDKATAPKMWNMKFVCEAAAWPEHLLAAHALGLGGMWRSGDVIFDPAIRQALGFGAISADGGFLYRLSGSGDAGLNRPGPSTVWRWGKQTAEAEE
jgi:hypothetical protein